MSEQVQYIAVLNNGQFVAGLNKIAEAGQATWGKLNNLQDVFIDKNGKARDALGRFVSTSDKGTEAQVKFHNETDKSVSAMKRMETQGDALGGLFNTIFASFGIFEVFQLGKSSLEEFDQQAKANAQTMAVLASTNGIAGKTFEDISSQADKLSKITLFHDDQVQAGENMLLTFTKVRGEIYDKTIPVLLDVSTAMNEDVKSAALQVGKALNDPIGGVQALRRVGVQFTDSQEAMVQKLVETGHLEEAQKIILQELQTEFGGSAKAAYEAANPLAKLRNSFLEIQEKIGDLIGKALNFLNPAFKSFASTLENVVGWVDKHQTLVGTLIAVLGSFVGAIFIVVGAMKIWTAVQWLLNTAITANPIGATIVAIIALIGVVVYLWNKFEGFRGFLVGLWESFKAVFTNLRELAGNVLGGIGELLIGVFTFDKEKIMSGFSKLKSGFVEYGEKVGESFKVGYYKGVGTTDAFNVPGPPGAATGAGAVPGGGDGTTAGQDIGSFAGTENKKNIYITINDGLVKNLNFNATNVQSSLEDMTEQIKRVLLTAVNNANMIPG